MTIAQDVEGSVPAEPPMTLIHTTTVGKFRTLLASGAIVPQRCPVMGVDLTYLFYGRPAYRPGPKNGTDRDEDSRPVCLLFRGSALGKGVGIYPCDTGAHHERRYSPHLDGVPFADLDCSAVPTAEGRIVSRYFETNDAYFYGEQRDALDPDAKSSVAASFFQFLVESGRVSYDDRSRTIEVVQDREMAIPTTLHGAILPDFLRHESEISTWMAQCKAAGVQVQTYRPQSQTCAALEVERRFPEVARIQGIPQ